MDLSFNERILQSSRPNFFELIAQEAMHEALRPAFQYLCKVLVHSRPDVLGQVWKFSDEIYLFLEAVVQFYFLRNHDGSFSENFYSLKRVSLITNNTPLNRQEKILSLLCLVFVSYLKVKLDILFLRIQEEDDAVPIRGDNRKQLAKLVFYKIYPYIAALWTGTKFVFRMRYLFGHSELYSPLLWIAGVRISRQLYDGKDTADSSVDTLWSKVASHLLPLGVFALKFLEWWYSTERSAVVKMMTSLPVPPPPKSLPPSPDGIRLPSNSKLCPLCLNRRLEPTALASSGYVFCYNCVLGYLREHGQCPITCIPTSERQLIRLFIEQQT